MRTIVTLISIWMSRAQRIPHGHALRVGAVPAMGSAAFALEMWTVNRDGSVFLLRDIASRLARNLPIYGGPDARTEHAIIAYADRLIERTTQAADILSKYRDTMAIRTRFNHGTRAASIHPPQRLGWPYPNVVRDSVLMVTVCLSGLWVIDRYVAGDPIDWRLTGENGALETGQLLVLVVTVIVAILAWMRTTVSSWRTVGIALACIAFVGAIREIPTFDSLPRINRGDVEANSDRSFAIPRYGKHVAILFASLVFVARGAYAWFAYPADRRRWFSPSFIWPVVPFATCLVLSEAFERTRWAMAEECAELLAYSMMLVTAVWVAQNAKRLNQAEHAIKLFVDDAPSFRVLAPASDQRPEEFQRGRVA